MSGITRTSLPGVILRSANRDDVPVIRRFIEALADYEKLRHECVATDAKLAETLFGKRPAAEVVLAEKDGQPVGFALFFVSYSTFLAQPGIYLEDLFVLPPHRGGGIGTALIAFLARLAQERGYGRVEWSVLDWNEPALKVYRSLGAQPMNEWTVQRVTGASLEALAQRFDNEFAD
jgi:GNAT superfamily N-acetyltransferase